MPDNIIAEIGTDRLGAVRDLAYRIWPECYAGVLPAERIGPMLDEIYAPATLEADIVARGHRFWLASAGDVPLGFASAYRESERIWLKKLYVLADQRGWGLGGRLVGAVLAGFPGAASLGLYVNDGNAPAIAWYKSQGFEVEAHVPVRMGPFAFMDYVMSRPL